MSTIELAKSTVQVNGSQWSFSGCTCLPWGHNADVLHIHVQSVSYIGQQTRHGFMQADGQVWWAVNSSSRSRVYAHNVAKGSTLELPNGGIQPAVLSLGTDGSGHVWMGHQGGLVQVWCAACQCPICQWSGMCPADIRCLSIGQHPNSMWLGTAQGSVCQAQVCAPDLGMQAKPTVKCMITLDAGRSHASKPASRTGQAGAALAPQSKPTQLAHDGPVSEIVTMSDRVVSNGGARTVASIMREWSLTGELIASHTPCKPGPVTCISVLRPDTLLQKRDTPQACTDSWRLLTGHQSGQVKLWAVPQGRPLQPLAILRASTPSPVQSLVVLDDLQLLCFGRAGSILLWSRDQLTKMAQLSCSYPPERGNDMKAVSLPKQEESNTPAAELHPMQRFFGSDSVQAMRAALDRFKANKQAVADNYSHSQSQMQPGLSTVQPHTIAHNGFRASALGRISETHSGFPSTSVSPASQAFSDIGGRAAAPNAVLSPSTDLLDSSGRVRSLNSYSPFANAPGPQMSGTLRPSSRSISWPNLPPMDDSDQESTQDMSRRSADEMSVFGNATGSRRAQAQSLPADAIKSSALYAPRQELQPRPPSQPSDVPALQKSSSFSRRASLASMLLKMRAGDDLSRNSSASSGEAASLLSSVNSADHAQRTGGPSATTGSSTGQGQPTPFSVGGKGHQQGVKFTDDHASKKEKRRLSSERIDRMAADVRLHRYHGGSMVSTPQNSGHSNGGPSISHNAGGHDSLSSDDSASHQALQPEMKRTISDVALEALESVQNLKCPIISYSQLDIKRKIGDGSIGQVYLAKWQETDVAVKVITQMQNLSPFQGLHPQDPATMDLQSQRQRGTARRSMELVDEMTDNSNALQAGQAGVDDSVLSSQLSDVELTAIATLEREVSIMAAIRHPNVVLLMGLCLNPVCVVSEFCARGSLSDVIKKAATSKIFAQLLDWPKRLSMALDAAKGMLQLHNHNPSILHRDLKSPNLLVDKHWRVKVTDFNLSSMLRSDADTYGVLSSVADNPRWLAPEAVAHQDYSKAADVYSFGIVLWELLTWQIPWGDHNSFQIMMLLTQQQARPDIPPLDSLPGPPLPGIEEYVQLMQACWHEEPDQRPGFESITGSLRLLLHQTAVLWSRTDRLTDLPAQMSCNTASGFPMVASQSDITAFPTAPPAETFHTVTSSSAAGGSNSCQLPSHEQADNL
ncbi:hypothetical protein WJX82_010624 [Trebouxia sp. C0006]